MASPTARRSRPQWTPSSDAESLVRAMVFNRLCAPDSKLGCLEWLQTVAIPGMPEKVDHDQLLRTMDALMDRADKVEAGVARLLRPMLDQQLSVVFYDLTTVRIHGEGQVDGDVRAFGMNKETGGIARQFVLGVVQSADGLPLMHTVHAGNVAETRTLKGMLETVLKRFAVERVIIVADRGLLSMDNVAELTRIADDSARKLQFILAVPARRYAELGETLEGLSYTDGLAEGRFAEHRLVVAHDPVRAAEQAGKRRERIREIEELGEKLVAKLDAHAIAAAERFDGKLVLLTNVPDFNAAKGVERYKSLADIERGFRVLKGDLLIAPVHHRLPERIRAHALICFLALTMYRVMRMRLKAAGHAASPTRALELLRRIQQHRATIGDQA